MKLTTLIIVFAAVNFSVSAIAQEVKKPAQVMETKMDRFTSKTGAFHKFVDTKLPALSSTYSRCETKIRKIIVGVEPIYFYQIVKSGQYSNSTASIEYSDLLEIVKAVNSLKTEITKDIEAGPDYLENKFVTVDGFEIGYFVESSKSTWYLKLEKYGTDNTLFIKEEATIENAFLDAKSKIEELKKASTK